MSEKSREFDVKLALPTNEHVQLPTAETCHERQIATCTSVIDTLLLDKASPSLRVSSFLASIASSRVVVLSTSFLYNWEGRVI